MSGQIQIPLGRGDLKSLREDQPEAVPLRDAVHVAVLLVTVADTALKTGSPFKIQQSRIPLVEISDSFTGKDGALVIIPAAVSCKKTDPDYVGVISPFLPANPKVGDHVYGCLHPATTQNLRHIWTHPKIDPDNSALRGEAEEWLRHFADEYAIDWDDIENLGAGNDTYLTAHGSDLHSEHELPDGDAAKLRYYLSIYFNRSFIDKTINFSCSC